MVKLNSSLNEMIKRNAFPKRKGATFATSIYHSIMCLRPSYKAGALVEDLTQVWERYNAAQARYVNKFLSLR